MESLQEHIQQCVKCDVLKIEQHMYVIVKIKMQTNVVSSFCSSSLFSPLDLSAVAAGERGSDCAPGEQHGQPASGQLGPHSGDAR